jgi:hypothetical protein
MSASTFLKNSSLRWAHDNTCGDHGIAGAGRGEISGEELGSGGYTHQIAFPLIGACRHHGDAIKSNAFTRPRDDTHARNGVPQNEGFFLELAEGAQRGEGTNAPVYYEYRPHRYVTYWFLYGYNDAPSGPRPADRTFDHQGDWERLSVQLNQEDRAITIAYYGHDSYCTRPWSEAGKHNGHPLAYSAQGTHATYPKKRDDYPLPGGLKDRTGRGAGWATYRSLLNARTEGWFNFGGAWGRVGEPGVGAFAGDPAATTGPLGPSRPKGAAPTDWSKPCD